MAQQQSGLNSRARQCHGRRRSNSSSCVSDSSDRSSELEVDSLPSRPYSSIGMQRPWIPNALCDVNLGSEDLLWTDPHSGLGLHQPVHDNDNPPAHGDAGIGYREIYSMLPPDDNMAHEPSTSEPYTDGFYSQLDANSLPSNQSFMMGTDGYPYTIPNIARYHPSSLYTPTSSPSPPMHPTTVIYNPVIPDHQPIWNYCVTHPPSHSGMAVPRITYSHACASPNGYIYSTSPVSLAPFVSGPSTRTQAVGKVPTQISEAGRRWPGVTKQLSAMRVSVEMNKQEHKIAPQLLKETPLEAIRGHVLEFAFDQKGSFWLQEKLGHECDRQSSERATFESTLRWLFNELRGSVVKLSMDTFGNFIAQPFYLLCSDLQRKFVLAELQPSIAALCKDRHGCRVIQTVLRNSDLAARLTVADAIRSDIVGVSNSEHGNHVVQLALDTLGDSPALLQDLMHHIRPIVVGKFGCKVVMHAYHVLPERHTDTIVNAILYNHELIVNDPHANYVWQDIVQHGSVGHREKLISCLSGSLAKLSSKPFASWCCQKALELANVTQREALINELLLGGAEALGDLATHKNGTHVFIMAMGALKDIPWSRNTIVQILSKLEYVKLRRQLSDDVRKCLARATEDLAYALLDDTR